MKLQLCKKKCYYSQWDETLSKGLTAMRNNVH